MAKLKEVLGSEVHWQVADWHTKDQANIRIRQLLGDDARYFAPLYVTHAGYYWSDPEPDGWTLLSDAPADMHDEVLRRIAELKQRAITRYPAQQQRIETVFACPNDDYVFVRRNDDMSLDIRITGWGFQNFHRAYGGSINETLATVKLRDVAVAFSVDGIRQAGREFSFFRGTTWADAVTGDNGLYSFGQLSPGAQLQLRDTVTGIERIVDVDENTSVIDVDVTEYLTLRVNARHDNVPVQNEEARVEYGHRTAVLTLSEGVAECRLPYLHEQECTVVLRGETQRRQLEKNVLNVFDFEFVTPVADPPEEHEEEMVDPGSLEFDAKVLVLDRQGNVVPGYPIVVDVNGSKSGYITDAEGTVAVGTVVSGEQMTVIDAVNQRVRETYTLIERQDTYVFVLPYEESDRFGDCTLRVIEKDGNPSVGTTCILAQENVRQLAHLDPNGEMRFASSAFTANKDIEVHLYSDRRTFPPLSFTLDEDEKEYEFREVSGPTPWWKIAGEILLVLVAAFAIYCLMIVFANIFSELPLFFS